MQKIKGIELPDALYKLNKVKSLRDGILPNVNLVGRFPFSTTITVGLSVAFCGVPTWFTTPVTKIKVLKNKVIFHTENSIYELEEVHEV